MDSLLLDTNVLLRFLMNDHPAHHAEAERLFAKGEKNQVKIIVLPIVIAETIFVLSSFYKVPVEKIVSSLEVFVSQRWLSVPERSILICALGFFAEGKHFVDAYLQAWTKVEQVALCTFDKRLARDAKKTR